MLRKIYLAIMLSIVVMLLTFTGCLAEETVDRQDCLAIGQWNVTQISRNGVDEKDNISFLGNYGVETYISFEQNGDVILTHGGESDVIGHWNAISVDFIEIEIGEFRDEVVIEGDIIMMNTADDSLTLNRRH